MAERDLKKLNRADLLEMLVEVTRENELLQQRIEALENRLSSREIDLATSGSIAEAALRINGVFAAAEAAAQQYLENVKRLHPLAKSAEETDAP